jgi:hypothetical protein
MTTEPTYAAICQNNTIVIASGDKTYTLKRRENPARYSKVHAAIVEEKSFNHILDIILTV